MNMENSVQTPRRAEAAAMSGRQLTKNSAGASVLGCSVQRNFLRSRHFPAYASAASDFSSAATGGQQPLDLPQLHDVCADIHSSIHTKLFNLFSFSVG